MEGLRVSKLEEGQQWGKNTSSKDKVHWGRRPPFIGGGKSNRYAHSPHRAVLPLGRQKPNETTLHRGNRAVLLQERYYRLPLRNYRATTEVKITAAPTTAGASYEKKAARYYRSQGAVLPRKGGCKKLHPRLLPHAISDRMRGSGTTAHQERYYRVGRGSKKLLPRLLPCAPAFWARGSGTTAHRSGTTAGPCGTTAPLSSTTARHRGFSTWMPSKRS